MFSTVPECRISNNRSQLQEGIVGLNVRNKVLVERAVELKTGGSFFFIGPVQSEARKPSIQDAAKPTNNLDSCTQQEIKFNGLTDSFQLYNSMFH